MKKKLNAALSLALITLLSLTLNYGAFADQPPDNVQGNWTIYSTSIQERRDGRETRPDRAIRQSPHGIF